MAEIPGRLALALCVALLPSLLWGCSDECSCGGEGLVGTEEASAEELDLLRLINDYRREAGLASMEPSRALFASSHRHAWDLQENHMEIGHVGSDGSTMAERITEAGYSSGCLGENVHGAWNCGFDGTPCVLLGWQNSPPHNAALLDEDYLAIGLGIHGGISVANFGCSEPDDPLE